MNHCKPEKKIRCDSRSYAEKRFPRCEKALSLLGDSGETRQSLLGALPATARDKKCADAAANNYVKQKMSFNTRLGRASMACLALLLAGGCTQPPQSQQSVRSPAAIAPANAPAAAKPESAQPDVCKTTAAKISDSKPPTNVRSSPEVKPNNIVGKLNNGTLVSVKSEKNGWFEISEPVKGWVSKSVTQSDCNEKTKHVSFPANSTSTTISGRFIGTGSHQYLLKAAKGQTMTVTVEKGPLPFVFAPGDRNQQKDLTGGGAYSNKKSWSGQLAEAGEYTLQLESNRSGYDYKFAVQVK